MEEGREQTDRQASAFLSSESGREWKPSSFTYELDRQSPLAAPDQSPGFNPSPTSSSSYFSSFSTSCSSCRCALVVHRHRFHQFAINFNLKPPAKPLNPSRSQRLRSTPFATLPRAHAALSRPSPVPLPRRFSRECQIGPELSASLPIPRLPEIRPTFAETRTGETRRRTRL